MCAVVSSAGFLSEDALYCTDRMREVAPDDGCTFGVEGDPARGCLDPYTSIAGHAAVEGACWG